MQVELTSNEITFLIYLLRQSRAKDILSDVEYEISNSLCKKLDCNLTGLLFHKPQ